MPGTYTFKPVEAKLTQGASGVNATNPYCTFVVGNDKIQSQVCTKGGQHPHWTDSVTIPIPDDPSAKVVVMLKDKGRALNEEDIGSFTLNLKDIQQPGQVSKWYNLSSNGKAAGQILIESSFKPSGQKKLIADEGTILIKENLTTLEQALPESIYIEQKQVIEPHTFVKQVETVETRSHTKEIEVMEPIKVIKQVPVTETVHVKKLVEVTKPEVVTKEIEVMEPQLVTKVIQVVEDVPVKRKVEVVEMRTVMEEIDTMEPQTVMKAVEVTEYVPVKKTVQVTEPVTIKKDVEYVEPVITTKTVTKEIPQPVIISEQISCSTGPATLLGLKKGEVVVERKMMKEEVKQQVKAAEVVVKEKKITEKVVEAPTKAGKEVVAEKVEVQETVKPLVKKSLATAVTATTATTAAAIKKTGGVFSEHDFF